MLTLPQTSVPSTDKTGMWPKGDSAKILIFTISQQGLIPTQLFVVQY